MKNGLYQGYDLASLQGVINFKTLKNQGTDFVICRCYVGNDFKDTSCESFITQAKDNGIAVGLYQFLYPISKLSPTDQANLHFNNSNKSVIAHCIDIEWPDSSIWSKPPYYDNGKQINDWCLKYLEEYKRISGLDPIVYTFPYFARQVSFSQDYANYRLWIASYEKTPVIPKPWQKYCLWQDSGNTAKLYTGATVDTDLCPDLSIFGSAVAQIISTPAVPEINTQPIIIPPVVAATPIEVAPATEPNITATISKINLSKLLMIGREILAWLLHYRKFDF
jgi:hypothetical protein